MYLNLTGTDDLVNRLFIFTIMAIAVAMGTAAENVFKPSLESNTSVIYATLVVIQAIVVITFRLLFACRVDGKFFPNFAVPIVGVLLMALPFFISCFTQSVTATTILWWIGIIGRLVLQPISFKLARFLKRSSYSPAVNIEHYTERYGLFTIIVLGKMHES